MPVLAVDLALLRDVLLPELTLTPGRAVMARVVTADGGGRGTLSIAGYLIDAELPRELRAGQAVRLEVRDVDAQRVLLGIAGHETTADVAGPGPIPAPAVPLPGGAVIRLADRADDDAPGGRGGGRRGRDAHALALRFDGAALGAVDLRFELDPGALRVTVALAPGEPLARAREQADALRAAVAQGAADRVVSVDVVARREPLDVYA